MDITKYKEKLKLIVKDLMKLQKEVNRELVLGIEDSQPFIEIYDCYRE